MSPPRKPKDPPVDDSQEIYIRWAKAVVLCGDHRRAAIGVGIVESTIDGFLKAAQQSSEAQRILAEEAVFVPDFKSPEKLREAILGQLWREARGGSTASAAAARVSALKAISDISGISNPDEAAKGTANGGMLMIPVMSMDKWEKACEKAQAALKAEVHD